MLSTPLLCSVRTRFDHRAEGAARLYTGIFANSKIVKVAGNGEAGREIHQERTWNGHDGGLRTRRTDLYGSQRRPTAQIQGKPFRFRSVARRKSSAGGDEKARQRGSRKDNFGVSWQVVPTILNELLSGREPEKPQRAMTAMLQMKKLVIYKAKQAYSD
jgi:predicted 3-demethylubiquinone-9 3-methyltransferase (glyoxalase superfamily)